MTRNTYGGLVTQFVGCQTRHQEVDGSNTIHSASCALEEDISLLSTSATQ